MSLQDGTGRERSSRDGVTTAQDITLERREIEQLKSFVGFDREDERTLESLAGVFDQVSDDLSAEYTDHVRTQDDVNEAIANAPITESQFRAEQRRGDRLGGSRRDSSGDRVRSV